ncbi:5-oxoprolinase/urea amidolyase family protein [Lampropedia puyangensis]|uniref:5-oxoprolinase/urea amidolyase family protein n=1 Tax=Lampropedia puyangensis TaxID=1330072 RepID=A0A4S8EZS1_9BURK|nr:urea amidolyase family protein [Lampropedia puyangensis]THT99253.1 5-oxoprolinase/urea amidolyase family protein [Lampropedia puyangensis]
MNVRCFPASDRAILVELDDLSQTLALFDALQAERPVGVQDMVPAARTILLEFAAYQTTAERVWQQVKQQVLRLQANVAGQNSPTVSERLVEIPVVYDGADLHALAELLQLTPAELIARHTGCDYQAAFAGFAPGFVYLAGGHPSFDHIPRLPSPRTKVPAGSVALAGHFSAVYPKDSPGGWQLIGTTTQAMWDLSRPEPALVQPGFRVRFVDATATANVVVSFPAVVPEKKSSHGAKACDGGTSASPLSGGSTWQMQSVGLQTLFQDLGRTGKTGMGVSASGALDRLAMREANRLVGNPVDTPVLENVMGGVQWRCHGPALVAITGARASVQVTTANGAVLEMAQDQALALDAGDCFRLGPTTAGLRCYIAVRGGFDVAPVLDSCATDTLAGVGPAPLLAGDLLSVGQSVAVSALQAVQLPCGTERPALHNTAEPLSQWPKVGDEVALDIVLGPRTNWFTAASLALLTEQVWEVTAQSNRVGIRLAGEIPLTRQADFLGAELPSEGTVVGALQVPANGQPVLFLADHPLTGGYPVVGAVASHHLDLAAQIPPGARVRFRLMQPFVVRGMDGFEGV